MLKIILKDNAVIYIDEFNYNEKDGKCRLYDTNGAYIDYFEEDGKTLNDYLNYIKNLQELTSEKLASEIIDLNSSIVYLGNSAVEVLEDYKDYLLEDEEVNEYIIDAINIALKHPTTISLNYWELNQIGNIYFMMF